MCTWSTPKGSQPFCLPYQKCLSIKCSEVLTAATNRFVWISTSASWSFNSNPKICVSPGKLHECIIFTAEGNVVIDRSRGVERFAFVVVLICGLDLALFDTALFKKMNILFEWMFWILKKWIIFLNEYSGF